MDTSALEVVNVRKRYGAATALDGVSFQVRDGEMFGLLGPNGAGKTTLLSIVSALLEPTSGEVHVFGQRVTPRNRDVRRQLGIVPQELAIYGELTARENLVFFGELYGLAGHTLQKRVGQILAAMGLEDRADRRVDTFSGGMKRRLNLGAALVHQPQLLLLDEPTTGVDPQSRNHVFEEVRRLNAAGVTIVYTSHYMEEVQALCARIGIIDHGRLIACDTLQGLLRQLQGLIRCRVPQMTPLLHERVRQLPKITQLQSEDGELLLECSDVKGTLVQLIALLNELHLPLEGLETEEPNLERVFLHLTGRGLRD
jgi:linearmycin/streptolysin S transport system ATP-binding protein